MFVMANRLKIILCFLVLIFQCCAESAVMCKHRPVDVIFLLDGSRSVLPQNFQTIKEYVKNFTNMFDQIGPDGAQIGVVQFASTIREEIRLDQYSDRDELLQAINDIQYMSRGTMTGEALKYTVNVALTPSHGSRLGNQNVHTVALVITDGKSQDYTRGTLTEWQRKAKERGIELYAIGIGSKTNDRELLEIASTPKEKHKFHTDDFDGIETIGLNLMHLELCDEDECAEDNHGCEHICNNTDGSYTCSCNLGYILQEDRKSCAPLPAPTPVHLRFSQITHTSALTQWEIPDNDVNNIIDHYAVVYTRNDGVGNQTFLRVFGNTSVELVGLDHSARYDVSVSTVTANDFSKSAEGSFTTLSVGGTSLILSNPTASSITATWPQANGDGLTGYQLTYREVKRINGNDIKDSRTVSQDLSSKTLSTNLTGLKPGTTYFVQVTPLYGKLEGRAGSAEASTEKLLPPTVHIVNTTVTSLTLNWSNINFPVKSWTVKIFPKGKNRLAKRIKVKKDVKSLQVDNLIPSTVYKVEVFAQISYGRKTIKSRRGKTRGRTKNFTTVTVTCRSSTESTILIEWNSTYVDVDAWNITMFPEGEENATKSFLLGGDTRRYTFSQLQPATSYTVEIFGNKIVGDENAITNSIGSNLCVTHPRPPRNLKVLERGFHHLRVAFDSSSSPVESYTGQCIPAEGPEEKTVKGTMLEESENVMQCTNLDPATLYDINIISHFRHMESEVLHTSNSTNIPSPTGLVLSNPTTHTLLAEWEPVDEVDVEFYYVSYNSTYDDVEIRLVNGNQNRLLLSDLEPDTQYWVQVQAEVNEILSHKEVATESTLPEIINLQIDDIGYTSINVSWNSSAVPHLRSYCLKYSPSYLADYETDLLLPPKTNSYSLSNLQTATEYKIAVNAMYAKTQSDDSEKFATTLVLPPIGPVNFTNITESSFVVGWLPPEGGSESICYKITYFAEGVPPVTVERVKETHLLIENLRPNTEYTVTISSCCLNNLVSQPIKGKKTTLPIDESSCTCSTYLKKQSQMESVMLQMVKKIEMLSSKIDELQTSTRSRKRHSSSYRRNKK